MNVLGEGGVEVDVASLEAEAGVETAAPEAPAKEAKTQGRAEPDESSEEPLNEPAKQAKEFSPG